MFAIDKKKKSEAINLRAFLRFFRFVKINWGHFLVIDPFLSMYTCIVFKLIQNSSDLQINKIIFDLNTMQNNNILSAKLFLNR